MNKVRVYKLAKELKVNSRKILDEAQRLGINIHLPSNCVSEDIADVIRAKYRIIDNSTLNDLLLNAGERQFWIKPWGHPDLPADEGQQLFNDPTIRIGFSRNPDRVKKKDILIVYRIKVSKLIFVAEVTSLPRHVTDEEIITNPLFERWSWSIETKNLTPIYGTHWYEYSLKPFDLANKYNELNPQNQVNLGSIQRGNDKLLISEGFGKFLIKKIKDCQTLINATSMDSIAGSDWSEYEVKETVESYFQMLTRALIGERYNKTEYRKFLSSKLERSKGAIEFKHQNISAALIAKGLPYIEGYKPLSNYQSILDNAIDDYIKDHPEFLDLVNQSIESVPAKEPEIINFDDAVEEAPELGALGEEFVVKFERDRLTKAGRIDLANKIERISDTKGDGAGYDVLSFEEDGSERFIEVKTTNFAKRYPFYLSANELDFSEDYSEKYYLYRVFNFKASPKLFIVKGAFKDQCNLIPTAFKVSF
jgi:hypothetical protein